MPLMICPRCTKFHYVPGACPQPRVPMASPAIPRAPSKDAPPQPVADLPKAGKKSTAALMEVSGKTTVRDALAQIGTTPPVKAAQPPASEETAFASTGDSIRKRVPEANNLAGVESRPSILTKAEAAAAHLAPKNKGGRPRKHVDRKAYKAEHERKRRAAAKPKQEE